MSDLHIDLNHFETYEIDTLIKCLKDQEVSHLQGHGQIPGIGIPDKTLDGHGIQIGDILKYKHELSDAFRQAGILDIQLIENILLRAAVHMVQLFRLPFLF